MEKRVRSAAVFSVIAVLVAISLVVAPAALAQEGQREQKKNAATDKFREKAQDRLEAAKNVISEKKENLQEQLQERKTAAKEKVQGKKEAVREQVKEKAGNVRERLNGKREVLKARVTSGDAGKVSALGRQRLKELEQLTPVQANARLAGLKIIKAKENFKIRPLGEEKLRLRRVAFEKLKEDDDRLRTEFKEKAELASDAKKKLEKCGSESESGECGKIREEALAKAKDAALKAVDRIVTHIQKLKEKIAGSENMPEEEAVEITAKIDALTEDVEVIKQKIAAAATKKDLNNAIKELREAVKKVKRRSDAYSQSLLKAEINGVIHRSEVAEKNLDCSLGSMEASGTDTSAVDAKLDDFSSKVSTAREKLKQAREQLSSEDDAKIAEGKNLVKEARDLIQEAHTLLQEIRKSVTALGGQPCQKEEQELVIETETPQAGAAT